MNSVPVVAGGGEGSDDDLEPPIMETFQTRMRELQHTSGHPTWSGIFQKALRKSFVDLVESCTDERKPIPVFRWELFRNVYNSMSKQDKIPPSEMPKALAKKAEMATINLEAFRRLDVDRLDNDQLVDFIWHNGHPPFEWLVKGETSRHLERGNDASNPIVFDSSPSPPRHPNNSANLPACLQVTRNPAVQVDDEVNGMESTAGGLREDQARVLAERKLKEEMKHSTVGHEATFGQPAVDQTEKTRRLLQRAAKHISGREVQQLPTSFTALGIRRAEAPGPENRTIVNVRFQGNELKLGPTCGETKDEHKDKDNCKNINWDTVPRGPRLSRYGAWRNPRQEQEESIQKEKEKQDSMDGDMTSVPINAPRAPAAMLLPVRPKENPKKRKRRQETTVQKEKVEKKQARLKKSQYNVTFGAFFDWTPKGWAGGNNTRLAAAATKAAHHKKDDSHAEDPSWIDISDDEEEEEEELEAEPQRKKPRLGESKTIGQESMIIVISSDEESDGVPDEVGIGGCNESQVMVDLTDPDDCTLQEQVDAQLLADMDAGLGALAEEVVDDDRARADGPEAACI